MSPFLRKLRHATTLTQDDEAILTRLAGPIRRIERGDIMVEGTQARSVLLIIEGWVCRYRHLENGKRQITALFLPGDVCEPFGALPRTLGDSLAALTPVAAARIAPNAFRRATQASARVEEALWWDLLLSIALEREHLISLGRRSATERLGHFFCEIHLRLGLVGLVEQSSCDMALTQVELSDLLGLSPVHVNRSLQDLRGHGLLSLRGRRLTIHDLAGLRELSMFDPNVLPLTGVVLAGTATQAWG